MNSPIVLKRSIIFALIMVLGLNTFSQNKFTINGYVSQMGSGMFFADSSDVKWDYVLHNRINMSYYANDNLIAHLEFRNQFVWGETMKNTPNYAQNFEKDKGLVDLNWNWFHNDNNLLNTQIDRAYVEYTRNNLELTIGRQRINWGRTLVWNPNDIFNAYSYYDFDYMEKPGSDAVRAVYYTGSASSIEGVVKVDSANHVTSAALYKFNRWGTDFQFLGGYANGEDLVFGTGWEGNIKSFALRGELSYYHPTKNFADTSGVFLATVGTDISFGNSMMVQAEFLYNDHKTRTSLTDLMSAPANSKSLSISEYNLFVNVTYPITPILSAYAAGMYYTDQKGYFLMPGFDLSLTDNMSLSLIYQYFNVEIYKDQRLGLNMAFARLKWNF